MKDIFVLLLSLFLFVTPLIAQPAPDPRFNPFISSCMYSSTKHNFIFYGRTISYEHFKEPVKLKHNGGNVISASKAVIEIDKVFKGNLPKRVEVFFPRYAYHEEGNLSVFLVNDASLRNSKVLYSELWSYRMNDFSEEQRQSVFSDIRSRLKSSHNFQIQGVVIKKHKDGFSKESLKSFVVGYDTNLFAPVEGQIVEARKKKGGKVFRTNTNSDGIYKFEDLESGTYRIAPVVSEGYKLPSYTSYYFNVDKDACYNNHIIELKKAANLYISIAVPREKLSAKSTLHLFRMDSEENLISTISSANRVYLLNQSNYLGGIEEQYIDFLKSGKSKFRVKLYFSSPVAYRYKLLLILKNGEKIYYPNIKDKNEAEIIHVDFGKDTKINFLVP